MSTEGTENKAAGLRTRAASNAHYHANHISTLDLVLTRLHKVRKSGVGWQAHCPAHDDKHPSLSITQGDDKVLLHCHAGCSFDEVVAALGLDAYQLFDDGKPSRSVIPGVSLTDVRKQLHHELIVLSLIIGDRIQGKEQNDIDREREPVAVRRVRAGLEAIYGR
jgi:putative DNA primase/helicase